jgi:hypothetical protein
VHFYVFLLVACKGILSVVLFEGNHYKRHILMENNHAVFVKARHFYPPVLGPALPYSVIQYMNPGAINEEKAERT